MHTEPWGFVKKQPTLLSFLKWFFIAVCIQAPYSKKAEQSWTEHDSVQILASKAGHEAK
uniref:Uncharacterized protein n=1 Tax=Anguilla anguilla TaxID=7936 RepID=A0A0E9QUN8_ANGAN